MEAKSIWVIMIFGLVSCQSEVEQQLSAFSENCSLTDDTHVLCSWNGSNVSYCQCPSSIDQTTLAKIENTVKRENDCSSGTGCTALPYGTCHSGLLTGDCSTYFACCYTDTGNNKPDCNSDGHKKGVCFALSYLTAVVPQGGSGGNPQCPSGYEIHSWDLDSCPN